MNDTTRKILKACEDELAWSAKTNKTFRYHVVESVINGAVSGELEELAKSFQDDKDYKGYMVKQVINARLQAEASVSDLASEGAKATTDSSNPPSPTPDTKALREEINACLIGYGIRDEKLLKKVGQESLTLAQATTRLEALITSKVIEARIDELNKLLRRRDCLRPWCTIEHTYLTKLHVKARINTLKEQEGHHGG